MEIVSNETVAVCEYCGTKQTLPRLDDERKANLYDRASHFRRSNEFDRAIGIYEQILTVDETDAESYWSLVLCRYGIEYVEDPASRKRIPTVNRTQTKSIFTDEDYLAALRYADGYQRAIYEEEAAAIDRIQKGILDVSRREAPFDVFLCYKESDRNGRRTVDSVLAMDLYKELTAEGYRVFFSRITLEDKLGTAYEPYIYAALTSAKVMIVVGTRPEHFNAVWVKNEWSRYLALIHAGEKKYLIPAYRDMDPYDLPEEFSHLQAQDMSKLGFLQDLVHGVKKLIGTRTITPDADNTEQLIRRAFLALEDGEWKEANAFCEQVLNRNAEHPMAYLGKLMAALQVRQEAELVQQPEPFDSHPLYQKVLRFDDGLLAARLQGYNDAIRQRKADQREQWKTRYFSKKGLTVAAIAAAVVLVVGIAAVFGVKSHQKKTAAYENAAALLEAGSYSEAMESFAALGGFRDSREQMTIAEGRLEEARRREEAYVSAVALLEEGQYAEAVAALAALGDYKDAATYLAKAQIGAEKLAMYEEAATAMEAGDYEAAAALYAELDGFEDSREQFLVCQAEGAWSRYRAFVDGAETVDFDAAAACLEELTGAELPLAAEYRDNGYYELAKLAYAADDPSRAELYLGRIADTGSFDDFEAFAEDLRLLKLYLEAQSIEVTNEETKAALQGLIDQLPEDYRDVAGLNARIEQYVDSMKPQIVDNSIILGTWENTDSGKGRYAFTFYSDGTYLYEVPFSYLLDNGGIIGNYYLQRTNGVLYLIASLYAGDRPITISGNTLTIYYDDGSASAFYRK